MPRQFFRTVFIVETVSAGQDSAPLHQADATASQQFLPVNAPNFVAPRSPDLSPVSTFLSEVVL